MKKIISSLPAQIRAAVELIPEGRMRKKNLKRIIICGMGGSGISGELLQGLYPDLQIISNKDYSIPGFIDKDTLSIIISYSGNTEETVSNYKILLRRGTTTAVISSDGWLLKRKSNLKIEIPKGLPPRGAIGYLFTPLPFILYKFHLIERNPQPQLLKLARFLEKKKAAIEKKAKGLAAQSWDKFLIIYADSKLFFPVARRWQCQLNENSKLLAHINLIPEMCHNEIVGLGRPAALNRKTNIIFLNDPAAHPRNRLRVKILKKTIKKKFSRITEITPQGQNGLQRLFWTIMLGDFFSYYCAAAAGIDPMPVKRIDYLKKELSKIR